jgi:hypothetical protein
VKFVNQFAATGASACGIFTVKISLRRDQTVGDCEIGQRCNWDEKTGTDSAANKILRVRLIVGSHRSLTSHNLILFQA